MRDRLDLLIYLDEVLIMNLSSAFFSGYVDIRTHREINDKHIAGKIHEENKEQSYEEDRYSKDIREGYKGKISIEVGTYQNSIANDRFLETTNSTRVENEIKKIYTSFSLHNDLINGLYEKKMIREINNNINNISVGEYIELTGNITTISVVSYLDVLIDILTCYGTDELNKLLKNNGICKLDYTKILNMLTHLLDLLTKNNTQDLLIRFNDTSLILIVNTKFFLNENACIFDKVHCSCKVIGKVMKISEPDDKISLLRKTAQFEYYERLINSINPLLIILQNEGIIIPKMPQLSISDNYLLIAPISIYI